MTICPVALAVGCRKCPIVGVCPAKRVIGDYKDETPGSTSQGPATGRKAGSKKP